MPSLSEKLQIVGQLKGAFDKLIELRIAESHLFRHGRTVGIAYFALPMANLCENVGLPAVMKEEVVVVIPLFLGTLSESLLQ